MEFQKDLWKADRIDAGLTQAEESELLETTRVTLSRIENGKFKPGRDLLAAKASLYERKARYYFGIDDDTIFDQATEQLQILLGMPLDTDELRPRDKIQLINIAKKLEADLEGRPSKAMPTEAQRKTEETLDEELLDEGVSPLDEIEA